MLPFSCQRERLQLASRRGIYRDGITMLQRLLLAFLTLVVFALPADAAKRVALVIGNAKYTHFSALANPDNDASSIAQALRDAKFDDVELASDLDFNSLKKALKNFSSKAVGAEVAWFTMQGTALKSMVSTISSPSKPSCSVQRMWSLKLYPWTSLAPRCPRPQNCAWWCWTRVATIPSSL